MTGPPVWRSLRRHDLGEVVRLADASFPDHPEEAARFAERLARGGDLCLALASGDGTIAAYAIAYPWPLGRVPALNRSLSPPAGPDDAIYLHDLAVHPALSGAGHARTGLDLLVSRAREAGHTAIALVAVNRSEPFWRARGFAVRPAIEAAKLASYGADARYMVLTL